MGWYRDYQSNCDIDRAVDDERCRVARIRRGYEDRIKDLISKIEEVLSSEPTKTEKTEVSA